MSRLTWLPRVSRAVFGGRSASSAVPVNPGRAERAATLWKLFLFTYIALLAIAHSYLREIHFAGFGTVAFALAVFLTYGVIYLLPVLLPVLGLNVLVSTRRGERFLRAARMPPNAVVYTVAALGYAAVLLFVFADTIIFKMYGFHFNGFVWNLLLTKGGVESMGGGASTYVATGLLVSAFVGLEAGFLFLLLKIKAIRRFLARLFPRKVVILMVVGVFALTGLERIAYGVCNVYAYRPVLVASRAFLFYVPCTFDLPEWMPEPPKRNNSSIRLKSEVTSLRYPLNPIETRPGAPKYNIVWLVAESLRYDMVDPEIMPATWTFAQQSQWFRRHYSGGNGTRMGIFAMFYGLYSNYWFPFLDALRGPVLMDLLLKNNYQFGLFTSAKFTYPEFSRTIWADIDPSLLHEGDSKLEGWENDRVNVSKLLDFFDRRDPSRPFLAFMFFESPHARYYFPPESIIRKDYLKDFNYVTTDVKEKNRLIFNRYINSCHHLDSQYERVLGYLKDHNLLDSTIVILTGDHGEEFMEKGRWGHNSSFVEEQIRPPLVMWIPGKEPRVYENLTSHLDIPPTLMNLLGVTNPPEDYCLGYDLLGPHRREYTVVGDWNNLGYVGLEYKADFSLQAYGFSEPLVTTCDDQPISDPDDFFRQRRDRLARVMKDMARFGK